VTSSAPVGRDRRRFRMPVRRHVDIALLLMSLAMGAVAGWLAPIQLVAGGGRPAFFYQTEFGPAVATVCGFGFRAFAPAPAALQAFLRQEVDHFSCDQIPSGASTIPPGAFAAISRYLELSVAAVWAVRGISWQAIDVLYPVFGATVAGVLYGLFRLGTSPPVAWLGTLLVVFSPLHLTYLPGLRDYAKAPFLLAVLLLMGWMVCGEVRVRRLAVLSLAAGLVLGVGLGFRNDLLLAIGPLMVTLIGLVPSGYSYRQRLMCVGVCAGTFLVVGAPIIVAYHAGNNSGHVAVLGLMSPFETRLGVEPGPYELGHLYKDGYVATMVSSEFDRIHGGGRLLGIGSAEYDEATMELLRRVAWLTPADLVVRAYAAVLAVLRAPFLPQRSRLPVANLWGWLNWHGVRSALTGRLAPVAPAVAALVVTAIAFWRWKASLALLMVLCVFVGGTALQFHPRHYFYLEFIGWWMILTAMSAAARLAFGRWKRRARQGEPASIRHRVLPARWAPGLVVLLSTGLAFPVVLEASRWYQQRELRAMFNSYLDAPSSPVAFRLANRDNGRVAVEIDGSAFVDGGSLSTVATALLRFDFGGPECGFAAFPVAMLYRSSNPVGDFSASWTPPSVPATRRSVFVPAYHLTFMSRSEAVSAEFAGLELSESQAHCLADVRQVRNITRLPVLFSVSLADDWTSSPLFQRLRQPPWPLSARGHVAYYVRPEGASIGRSPLTEPLTFPGFDRTSRRLSAAEGGRWRVGGVADRPFGYLGVSLPHITGVGDFAVARGHLDRGGVTVGLIGPDANWTTYVNVGDPGDFAVVLKVQPGLQVRFVVADFLPAGERANEFTLDGIGWAVERPGDGRGDRLSPGPRP
jgi:hypothetical protein